MRDITNSIKTSIATDVIWSINFFFSAIEKMENNGLEVSYWRDEENWASILADNQTIGYVWQKHPLIFVISRYADEIKKLLKEYGYITYIEASSLTDEKFRMDDHLKNDCAYGLTNEAFSAEDFWFHTNSI